MGERRNHYSAQRVWLFHSVKHSPVYQNVVAQIEEAILSHNLKAGGRLPSERRMTELFEISRRTLREAIRVLEQKGLVEVRTGSKGGAFVTDHSSERVREGLFILNYSEAISPERGIAI